jgi:dihydropteroate synthase-like protein
MQSQIHFVTGRLAEAALRRELESLGQKVGFRYTIQVLPITVAALLTPKWIAPRLKVPEGTDLVMLPGYCHGDLSPITDQVSIEVKLGPKDLRNLPEYFGQKPDRSGFGKQDIDIIAEINHAPRQSIEKTIQQAVQMTEEGADLIDVGCDPGSTWHGLADCIKELRARNIRCSVDSFNATEVAAATSLGAELVLSVNSTNREHALDWDAEVVVVPDDPKNWQAMEETIDYLAARKIPLRVDPILEPIGFGFAASLERYMQSRKRWPESEIMMGIGNLTELTDVDSAGVNVILLAICQELGIRSVLTTQVINWARSSVVECDIARKLVHYSIQQKVPPKHVTEDLVSLRDPKLNEFGLDVIQDLAKNIKDNNYRIFAEEGELHLLGSGHLFSGEDPFDLFDSLADTQPTNLDASHAFYLGYELSKALTALTLGKQYTQDQALHWGHLTQPEEDRHRLKKRKSNSGNDKPENEQ